MNFCSRCGRPKELHDRIPVPTLLPMAKPVVDRACVLEENRAKKHKDGTLVSHFRVDSKEMRTRQLAHDELRKDEIEDREVSIPKLDGVHVFSLTGDSRVFRAVQSDARRTKNQRRRQGQQRRRLSHGRKSR